MHGALGQALYRAFQEFGQMTAVSGDSISLTYQQLVDHAQKIAASLLAKGITKDEPVHLCVSNQPLDIAALLGIWLAGGVAVPIHRTTPPLIASGFQQRTRAQFLVDLRTEIDDANPVTVIATKAPPLRVLMDAAALIVFTSGSTGVPKGVVVAHKAFLGKMEQVDSLLNFKFGERTLLTLNITFSFGLWVSLLTLLRGGVLIMQSKFEPETFLNALVTERITRVGMVPTMMRVLFSDAQHEAAVDRVTQQGCLHQILIGGESLGRSLANTIRKSFSNTDLIDIYGLTETATCDFFAFPSDYSRYPGSIGRPSPNVRFRIVDAQDQPVEAGAVGELQIRSPYLMQGYLDDSALTTAAYCEGWFKTGDLGRVLDGQVVELMGRQKEVISRAGNKVTPVEVEQSICSHADVAAAMAVGIDDPLLGQRIHVLIVLRNGSTLSLIAIRKHLEMHLERFKHPDVYYRAEALPLGRTGKADREQFKASISAGAIAPSQL